MGFGLLYMPVGRAENKDCSVPKADHRQAAASPRLQRTSAVIAEVSKEQMCGYMGGVATEASTSSQALTSTTSGGKTPEATQESHLDANIGHGHVLKMLELFQEQNSLRSFSRSVEVGRAIGGDLNPGNESRTVATNLVKVCAGHEWYVNRSLLMNCSIWGLGQDGKDKALLVASRMVLWTLPKPMRGNLPTGVTALLPGRFGSKGPWVAERALGCEELGSDRGGEALAAATLNILKTTLPEPDDFKAVAKKGKFFTADNAADETIAHKCLRDELNALEFDIPDTTHSVMLAIKNGCKGDPEVDLVRGVFLTNKRPNSSISRCLQNSTRFRTRFTEQQCNDVYNTLSHLGWSPQRHSSQSRPWGRGSNKIESLMSALAEEVDNNGSYAQACLYNIRIVAPFGRMMIAGMLGDLTAEHLGLVRWDRSGTDPRPPQQALFGRFPQPRSKCFFRIAAWPPLFLLSPPLPSTLTLIILGGPPPYCSPPLHPSMLPSPSPRLRCYFCFPPSASHLHATLSSNCFRIPNLEMLDSGALFSQPLSLSLACSLSIFYVIFSLSRHLS